MIGPVPPSPARTSRKSLCSRVTHRGIAVAITLAQAAEATGRNRSTILRSIRKGALSATRDLRIQAWMVEPTELFRVFPPVPASSDAEAAQGSAQVHKGDDAAELRVLMARLEAAEARARDKDATIAEQRMALDDLRRRLDQREADHRTALDRLAAAQERIAALLTDQRAAAPAPPRRSWWGHRQVGGLPWRARSRSRTG
jgi:hypothetical protein